MLQIAKRANDKSSPSTLTQSAKTCLEAPGPVDGGDPAGDVPGVGLVQVLFGDLDLAAADQAAHEVPVGQLKDDEQVIEGDILLLGEVT